VSRGDQAVLRQRRLPPPSTLVKEADGRPRRRPDARQRDCACVYKLFLTARYLRKRRIAYFAIAAVTLCVAMVLVVMSVMGGWLDLVMKHARGLLGDVIVDNRNYAGFPLYEQFIDEISGWPEIEAATPVIYTAGLMRFPETEQLVTVRVVGLRLQEACEVTAFRDGLFYERFYPGTTTLAPQQRPMLGVDPDAEPLRISDGRLVPPPVLPEPYRSALRQAREEYRGRTGHVLDDTQSVDSDVSDLLRRNNRPIIPGQFELAEDFEPKLVGDPLPGAIIGRDIVAQRQSDGRYKRYYRKGERVTLTIWATSMHGSVDPIPIKQAFRYADDSRTGIYDIDSQHVYVDFALLQKLLEMDAADRVDPQTGETIGRFHARCSQIQIKVRPTAGGEPVDNRALCQRLQEAYGALAFDERYDLAFDEQRLIQQVEAVTWQQSQQHIIGPVQKERMLVTILFGIISLVAVALILCILYMIVLQKTRDIGIIKAIGGSSAGVATIFVFYGAAVGIVGSILGTIFGALFVTYINEIQDFLISINPSWRVWDLTVYSFDRIPSEVQATNAIAIVAIAIVASTFGSLAAAWRAGRMHPVEALRYE
jgi:lipoprotein-releasing system permease protein